MTQDEALAILKTGANVFLTGEPGSGKTHTINRYVSWLREHDIEPAITASTGIAATHIGGFTIHSWSGIGIRRDLSPHDLDTITDNKRIVDRVSRARILIIDEVSMLSARTLAMVETVCRTIKRNELPFGGLQIILVGDFFQLPPVQKNDEEPSLLGFEQKQSQFAFISHVWHTLSPLVCYLSEQHRQEDSIFLDFLSAIRNGAISPSHRTLLRSRYSPQPRSGITQLYAHNADVNTINASELGKLASESKTFTMMSKGPAKLVETLKRGCLSPEALSLKVGARVLFTKNDIERKYVNGTLGTITYFDKNTGFPYVKTNAGATIPAVPDEWRIEEDGRVLARITQIPLRLAWALTVHKSQGMSLDAAHMDLSRTFEYGQGYVALSRVRTLAGLFLAGLNNRALEIHPEIRLQDKLFRKQAEETQQAFLKFEREELQQMQENFITACGGSIKKVFEKKKKTEKIPTIEVTLALLKNGKSVEQIATERGLAQGTIFSHLEQLHADKRIGNADVEPYLSKNLKKELQKIHAAFKELGPERLKPIFEKFDGAYSYDDLHLARMLLD
ncbi:MAG: ATPase AAA [Parcubacteria group bacterium Gr01-1014_48]|nr:MAG: ATPase AAA [Parcubacteria group bacterium Greene0416_14]TSC71724.1 MAG: ATPase AAA [Parcubacteria group bacterium Gr01-1014_48]TSC99404.1 MAG: ATPase AAA [Parcubacteria group bacterium Greene1014_15]TSD06638.1 MAG: ATPase AAA [Parcubacteria group bacterium Greene0714_4]